MKFKEKFLIAMISFTLFSIKVQSQNLEIRGKVLDKQNLEAVPYSSISIKDASIGTCSNNRGEFIFHFPDSLKADDLTVKCLGYKSKLIQLDSLTSNEIANIYLEPEIYDIPEIQIVSNQLTATDIVKKVIRKMHQNYPRSPYNMEGFLRDKVYNLYDNKTTRLTEAAVEIVKKEFGNENNANRVKVVEIRNSYNYSKLGSWWKEKITQTLWGYSTDNPIYKALQCQDFTNPRDLNKLLKNDLYRTFISGYTMFDGKPVTIIDIKEEYHKFLFQKRSTNNKHYHLVKLYVDDDNYAMLKSEYYLIMNIKNEGIDIHLMHDSIATFAVKQYEKLNDYYYLKYAGYFGRVHDQPNEGEVGKTLYFNETELLINKLITNRKEFDRIKHRDLLEKDIPLWDMKYVYDPSFWKTYNILSDKPLDFNVQKDLEKDVPLDNQFYDAGEKNSKK